MKSFPEPNFEKKDSQEEKEQIEAEIIVDVFRHGPKESKDKDDKNKKLTKNGKKQSLKKADDNSINQSVAYGSTRDRTQQTAGYHMAGNLPDITGEESFSKLKEKLNENTEVGSKIGVDPRLDSGIDWGTKYGQWLYSNLQDGKFLSALISKSDYVADFYDDESATTYSKNAAKVAQLINRYVKASGRWHDLVREQSSEAENSEDVNETQEENFDSEEKSGSEQPSQNERPDSGYRKELKRYLGTHAGVAESFLAKVIEKRNLDKENGDNLSKKKKLRQMVSPDEFDNLNSFLQAITEAEKEYKEGGRYSEREKFIKAVGPNGFDNNEGFSIRIVQSEKDKAVYVSFKKEKEDGETYKFEKEISPDLIAEIAEERNLDNDED